jgi:hypothetical protein
MPRLDARRKPGVFFSGDPRGDAGFNFDGAPRTLRALLNFILLGYSASFEYLFPYIRQFHKESGLTLSRTRRQDATDFAAAN